MSCGTVDTREPQKPPACLCVQFKGVGQRRIAIDLALVSLVVLICEPDVPLALRITMLMNAVDQIFELDCRGKTQTPVERAKANFEVDGHEHSHKRMPALGAPL